MDLAQPPARAVQLPQQQRPSMSYFVFLSILFFLMQSNSGGESALSPNSSDESKTAFQRMQRSLAMREGKREGLARWLGMGNSTWEADHGAVLAPNGSWVHNETDAEGSYATLIPFVPSAILPTNLAPQVQTLMHANRGAQGSMYHQNLTGFVRGEWKAEQWSFDRLGLEETWNTTEMRVEVKESPPVPEGGAAVEGVQDNPASPAVRLISRQLASNSSTPLPPPPPLLVATNITHNRTLVRAAFPFTHPLGGKVSFNLREEQTSAVGPLKALGKGRGDEQLLELEEGGEREEWMKEGAVTYLKGDITLTSLSTFEDLVLDIEGVHLLQQGTIYAYLTPSSTRSHLFDAISLPFISPSLSASENRTAQAVGHDMLKEVDRRLVDDRKEVADGVVRRTEDVLDYDLLPHCTFALYGSLAPLPSSVTPSTYAEWYSSLFLPTGSSPPSPPPAQLSYTLYSSNCALVLSGIAEGLMTVKLWERVTSYAILMAMTQAGIVWVMVRQMERAGPGASSKIAYTTIAVQAAMDSYFFIIQFTIGIVTSNRSSLPSLVPAFLALISSLVFGMRYAAQVRAAAPPPVRRTPPPAPAVPPPPPPPTQQEQAAAAAERRARAEGADDEEAEPLVAPTPTPAIVPPARRVVDEESDWPWIVGGIGSAVCAGTMVLIWGWMSLILLLIYSYWIPQIVLNVQRGAARQTLRKEYVVGITVGRLVLPVYFWGYSGNVLAVETSPWIYALIAYNSFQASVLLMQDSRFGARFFLPRPLLAWLELAETETWDYHPLLPPPDVEAASLAQADDEGNAKEDCPICLSPIQIAPARPKDGKEKDALENEGEREKERQELRWGYMIPPCGHVAHTECLESWIEIKSVCPSCRARLPPL